MCRDLCHGRAGIILVLVRQHLVCMCVYVCVCVHVCMCVYVFLAALNSSARIEEIFALYRDQFKFPAAVGLEFRDLCVTHVRQQQALKDFAWRRIFNVTFKPHWLVHAGQRSFFLNPRMGCGAYRVKVLCSKFAR